MLKIGIFRYPCITAQKNLRKVKFTSFELDRIVVLRICRLLLTIQDY